MGENLISKIDSTSSNEKTSSLSESVSSTTGEVEYIIASQCSQKRESVNFIVERNEGVFLDLLNNIDSQVLFRYIDTLFQTGYYFLDFNYDAVMNMLYDGEKLQEYRENVKKGVIKPLFKIASGITSFIPARRELYRKPIISPDKKTAEYYFENVYSERMKDGKKIEIQETLGIDEFIAAMWMYGVRFGLDIMTIRSIIQQSQKQRLIISRERPPTESRDPILVPSISFEIDRGVKNDTLSQADYLEYKQGYIRVDKDVVIYTKKPGELGKPGRTIGGEEISPRELRDFSIESFRGKGLRTEMRDGCECLISEYNGFPRREEGLIVQGRQRVKGLIKIHIDAEKVFKEIGMTTGKVNLTESIVSEDDIILDTRAGTVQAKKDVEANIHATLDIIVAGNVIGVAQSTMLNRQHQRVSTMLSKGHLVSEHGNITVNGYINDSYLEAKEGHIQVGNATNSLVIGKSVVITGMVFNSIIVADTITLNGRTIGSRIIGAREITIKESSEKGDFENVISIFSRDLTDIIAKKQVARNLLITKIQEIESKIDDTIIQKFAALKKIESGKRKSMTRILVDLMQDPIKLKQEEYKGYIAIHDLLKSELQKHSLSWKKVKEINLTLDQLTQEIKNDEEVMNSEKLVSTIQISHIQGPTHVQRIKYLSHKKLLDFSVEEITDLSHLLANRDPNTELYKLEKYTN